MNRVETIDIVVALEQSEDQEVWKKKAARKLRVAPRQIQQMRLRKHSIDARQRAIRVQLRVEVGVGMELPPEPDIVAAYPFVAASAPRRSRHSARRCRCVAGW